MSGSDLAEYRVIGIDVSSRDWSENGLALLAFTTDPPGWNRITAPLSWGQHAQQPLTADTLAAAVIELAAEFQIAAVALDGPLGWRDPAENSHPGVSRACEYAARCQSKTGSFGRVYPGTQLRWTQFCTQLTEHLLSSGHAQLTPQALTMTSVSSASRNSPSQPGLPQSRFYLLETYPTATWKQNGLPPLPGKGRLRQQACPLGEYYARLAARFALPESTDWRGSHDDLQAVVAALPAAAFLGGPGHPIAFGVPPRWIPASGQTPAHQAEGLLWTCRAPDPPFPPTSANL